MRPAFDSVYKMAGPVVMGVFLGYYLDQILPTRPWMMLGLTFLGIATGFWSVLKPLYFPEYYAPKPEPEAEKKDDSA